MVNTRSKRGILLSTGKTPKRVHKRHRRMPPAPPVASRPTCGHVNPIACTCASSFPVFFVNPGKPRVSNPVSEQYLIANLEIDLRQLTLLIGASMAFKSAVKRIIMDREAQAHARMDYTQWRVNDGTGGALKWSSMAGVLLDEITTEEDPAERDPEVAGEWLSQKLSHPIDEDVEDRFFRSYTAGESTFAVARGLLLQFMTPFLITVMGYSGTGKSHTMLSQDGIIAAILGRLQNPIHIHVYEVLTQLKSIADFTYPENTIEGILEGISTARTTAKTPANQTSSRAHLLILFENEAGEPYGIIVDVAGAEESENRAEVDPDMKRTSAMIAIENGHIRSLLVELAKKGKAVFTSKGHVSEVKRASALNMEVARFLRRIRGELAVRVLLCLNGARMDLMDQSLTLVPEF